MSGVLILSREIASAMFRVAEIIKNDKIKNTLENAAILLVSEEDKAPKLDYVRNIILFCHSLKVVNPINIEVLIREVNNLEMMIGAETDKEKHLDISSMFSFSDVVSDLSDYSLSNDTLDYQGSVTTSSPVIPGRSAEIQPDPVSSEEEIQPKEEMFKDYEPYEEEETSTSSKRLSFDSNRITEYLSSGNKASFKELESAFLDVSPRTVRRALDILVREGKVDILRQGQNRFYFLIMGDNTPVEAVGNFRRISTKSYSIPKE